MTLLTFMSKCCANSREQGGEVTGPDSGDVRRPGRYRSPDHGAGGAALRDRVADGEFSLLLIGARSTHREPETTRLGRSRDAGLRREAWHDLPRSALSTSTRPRPRPSGQSTAEGGESPMTRSQPPFASRSTAWPTPSARARSARKRSTSRATTIAATPNCSPISPTARDSVTRGPRHMRVSDITTDTALEDVPGP